MGIENSKYDPKRLAHDLTFANALPAHHVGWREPVVSAIHH